MDSDKISGVPISQQMSTLYLPSDDVHAVGTDLKITIPRNLACKDGLVYVPKHSHRT